MTRAAALDGLNFSLADSASVLGPYLGIYLLTVLHWDQAAIGLVAMAGGLASVAAGALAARVPGEPARDPAGRHGHAAEGPQGRGQGARLIP